MTAKDKQKNGMQVVAREERLGDVSVVTSGYAEDGSLMVSEEVSGPSASVAYGESSHKVRVVFSPEAMWTDLPSSWENGAKQEGDKNSSWLVLQGGRHALIDLMDAAMPRACKPLIIRAL